MDWGSETRCKCDLMERRRRGRRRWRVVGWLSEEEVRQVGGLTVDWQRKREASLCVRGILRCVLRRIVGFVASDITPEDGGRAPRQTRQQGPIGVQGKETCVSERGQRVTNTRLCRQSRLCASDGTANVSLHTLHMLLSGNHLYETDRENT